MTLVITKEERSKASDPGFEGQSYLSCVCSRPEATSSERGLWSCLQGGKHAAKMMSRSFPSSLTCWDITEVAWPNLATDWQLWSVDVV